MLSNPHLDHSSTKIITSYKHVSEEGTFLLEQGKLYTIKPNSIIHHHSYYKKIKGMIYKGMITDKNNFIFMFIGETFSNPKVEGPFSLYFSFIR